MNLRKATVLVTCIIASALLISSPAQAQPQPEQPEGNAAAKAEVQALWEQAHQLRKEGKLAAAIESMQKMLAMERQVYGGQQADLAVSLEFLAQLQDDVQDYAAAEAARTEVLSIREQIYGPTDWRANDARSLLDMVQRWRQLSPEERRQLENAPLSDGRVQQAFNKGEVSKALDLAKQSLQVCRELLGEDHPEVAGACETITVIYGELKDLKSAEPYYREAARIWVRRLGILHPKTSKSLTSLADVVKARADQMVKQERFSEALDPLTEVLAIQAVLSGYDHWQSRALRVELTRVARRATLSPDQRNELERAEALNQEAIQCYQDQKLREAAEKSDQALAIQRKFLGNSDPTTLISMTDSAIFTGELGNAAMAGKLLREAADCWLQLLGPAHPTTRESMQRLEEHLESAASRHWEREEFDQSIAKAREIVRVRTILLGQDHWRTLDARGALKNSEILAGLTDAQRNELKTADKLHRNSFSLHAAGKYREALVPGKRALEIRTAILGEAHPAIAASLNNLAAFYSERGDYAKAEVLYQRSVNVFKQFYGDQHPKTAASLNQLGGLYRKIGAYAKAEPLYEQSLEIRKNVFGERHLDTAISLNSLASLCVDQNNYGKAEPLFERSLAIRWKILGDEHPDTASSLSKLAELYYLQGDYAKAEPLYRQSLEIRKKVLGDQHPDTTCSLNHLALLYAAQCDYARAEPLYRQCLEICKKARGDQHPDTVSILCNLANLYFSEGDHAKAEPLYRQCLEINKNTLGERHPDTAHSLCALAHLYERQGDYSRAEPLYRQNLEIRKEVWGHQHRDTADGLGSLAGLYLSIGDYAKAEPLYRQSLEIRKKVLGDQHPDTASSLNDLAVLCSLRGDYARAERLYVESLEITKRAMGGEHVGTATCLNNLGGLYVSNREYAKAEPLLLQGLEIRNNVLGDQHAGTASSLGNLAGLYFSQGDYAKAEPLYRQSLEIRKKVLGDQHPDTVAHQSTLAATYYLQGDYDRADSLFRPALLTTRASLETTALIQSERQQLVMAEGLRHQLDGYLSMAMVSQKHHEQAFREVLAWKGATLVRQRQMHKVGENTEVAPLFKQLQQTATRLATLSRMVPDPQQQAVWRRQITDLTEEKEKLEAELSQKSAEFRAAKKQVTLEDMLAALPKDAALVDFLEYRRFKPHPEGDQESRYVRSLLLAFVVRGSEPVVMLDLGPVAPLSEAIDIWRQTFGTGRHGVAAGRLLRERMWQPVEKHLEGSKLVLVSADGALGRLPIAALPGRKEGTYLLEDYRLAMLPVPQLLPAMVSKSGREELAGGLLVMGDVDYDADPQTAQQERDSPPSFSTAMVLGADTHFSHLPATVGEIATIKEVFTALFQPGPDAIKTLKQADATEQQFRQAASEFPNLHLATHGFFAAADKRSALSGDDRERFQAGLDREQLIRGFNPGLLSGLVFSGANRTPELDKDDGILTADEIAALSLEGVDLVVLSACETGLGEVAGGEGVLGVQRAFQVAGARSTVASLWQVGDIATRLLMERFYRNYWEKKMSKLDALREAQLYLLNHPDRLDHPEEIRGVTRAESNPNEDSKRLSPQFWAAFP